MTSSPDERLAYDYDAIVIGSGFAGAVTACRLSEAGKRVLVLERGRRYQTDDFPIYPTPEDPGGEADDAGNGGAGAIPDFSRAFWKLGQGLWDLRDLGDIVAVQAAGFGGGSLIYANVHLRPPAEAFDHHWPDGYSRKKLDPYYNLAAYMLEVEQLPDECELPKTQQLARAADQLGRRAVPVPLAVNFTRDENRFGVKQSRCDMRGDCCFGCDIGAKSTLDLNYLELAQRSRDGAGEPATVETLAEVVAIERREEDASYAVRYRSRLYGSRDPLEVVTARHVFLCAGAVNSTELLLKSRAAGLLPQAPAEIGSRYFPNADTVAVAFDCDALQESDRGPTITSTVLYDRAPDDDDDLARWHIEFDQGRDDPPQGCRVTGKTSRAEGILDRPALPRSGSWDEHSAAGELVLSRVRGKFNSGEDLQIRGARFARSASAARKSSHWFLVQDGGLPSAIEPMLGTFRSPLWVRRNRFDEGPERDSESRSPLPGYADLPFESLAELAIGLPRGPRGVGSLPARHMTDTALGTQCEPGGGGADPDLWSWLPPQLANALRHDRLELLDRAAEAAEPFVNGSIADIAERLNAEYKIEEFLKGLELPGLDVGDLRQWKVVQYALQLAIEVGFGSQALLARYAATRVLGSLDPKRGELGRRLFDVFRWAMDYRQSNGRTGVLLSMGRDSLPGSLSLDILGAPENGSKIVGQTSGATGILVSTSAEGAWEAGQASGSLVVAKLDANHFVKEELFCGSRRIGMVTADEVDLRCPEPAESDVGISGRTAAQHLRLCLLRFAPEATEPVSRTLSDKALLDLSAARVRASLPSAFDRPERSVQERLLRDIAATWNGELRTNPAPKFLGRELTVHSQGGCPMGREKGEGVTDANGEVVGCPGLFVMDAAAFPSSVGVNPSATILAIAEYKVERFLRLDDRDWRAAHYNAAQDLTNEQEAELDPLRDIVRPTPLPLKQPVGLEFDEKMVGRCANAHGQFQVTTELHATIRDLSRFLDHQRLRGPQQIPLSGTTTIESAAGAESEEWKLGDGSYMLLFSEVSEASNAVGVDLRQIRYHLKLERFESDGTLLRRDLDGEKNLRDDEGFDAWEDTTTLYVTISDASVEWARGVLRVPAEEFFGRQIPSFHVTNTSDRARQSWALAAFARFFFGNLVDVYVPELDRVVDVVKNLVERSHD